jgi:hypothetical protein
MNEEGIDGARSDIAIDRRELCASRALCCW